MDPLPLDDQQLELIEAGRCGLRALTVPEEALVETSSRERASRRRISRRRRIAGRVLAAPSKSRRRSQRRCWWALLAGSPAR